MRVICENFIACRESMKKQDFENECAHFVLHDPLPLNGDKDRICNMASEKCRDFRDSNFKCIPVKEAVASMLEKAISE